VHAKFDEHLVGWGWMHHVLQAVMNTLVASNSSNVRSLMAALVKGLLLAMEIHWTLQRHSHNVLMGSSGVHNIAMLAQLASSLAHVMGPYVMCKCMSMAATDMLVKLKVSSSSTAR